MRRKRNIGDTVSVTYYRGGNYSTVNVTLEKRLQNLAITST
jgi:S1-C subfamily serine protease